MQDILDIGKKIDSIWSSGDKINATEMINWPWQNIYVQIVSWIVMNQLELLEHIDLEPGMENSLRNNKYSGSREISRNFQVWNKAQIFLGGTKRDGTACRDDRCDHAPVCMKYAYPDSKVHGANMGPTWVLSAPDGPHVGPMNLVSCKIVRVPLKQCQRDMVRSTGTRHRQNTTKREPCTYL